MLGHNMKIQNTHECSGKAAFFKVTKQQLNSGKSKGAYLDVVGCVE